MKAYKYYITENNSTSMFYRKQIIKGSYDKIYEKKKNKIEFGWWNSSEKYEKKKKKKNLYLNLIHCNFHNIVSKNGLVPPSSNPSAWARLPATRSHCTYLAQVLNALRDGASTASLGSCASASLPFEWRNFHNI